MTRNASLHQGDWEIRTAVYCHFVDTGRAPSIDDLTRDCGLDGETVLGGLDRLAAHRHLVMAPSSIEIWMAHPFSAVPTDYPVQARGRTYFANCAWDAFGIPAIVDADAAITSRCAETGAETTWRIRDGDVVGDEGVVHFLVPVRDFWRNVGYT